MSITTSIVLWIARLISFFLVLNRSQSIWIAINCTLAIAIVVFEVLVRKAMSNLRIDKENINDLDFISKKISEEIFRLENANLPWLILAYLFFPILFEIVSLFANR